MKRKLRFFAAFMALMVAFSSLTLADPPDWEPPTNMAYQMTVVAKLQIGEDGEGSIYSESPADLVAAFVGDEVRGVSTRIDQTGDLAKFLQLIIYSNASSGEEVLTFKAYYLDGETEVLAELVHVYAAEGEASLPPEGIFFSNGAEWGSITAPYIFEPYELACEVTVTVAGDYKLEDEEDEGEALSTIEAGEFVLPYDGESALVLEEVLAIECDGEQAFVITPGTGRHIAKITVDGTEIEGEALEEALEDLGDGQFGYLYEWNDGNDVASFTVTFALNTYSMTYRPGANGKITIGTDPDPTTIEYTDVNPFHEEADVPYGNIAGDAQITVTAEGMTVDDMEYEFYAWSDGWEDPDGHNHHIRTDVRITDTLDVTALFSPAGWTVTPGFQYGMQVTGLLVFNDVVSLNSNDMVGAFVGEECRGVASPNGETGLILLSIGSNFAAGEEIELKLWNSEANEGICIAAHTINFQQGTELGDIDEPHIIQCESQLAFEFGAGYTWFSSHIDIGNDEWSLNEYFVPDDDFVPQDNDRIIGQTAFALYHDDSWVGGLTDIDPKQMYRIKMTAPEDGQVEGTITLKGGLYKIEEGIELNAGHTWLGYLPAEAMSPNDALVFSNPGALQNNDRLIAQTHFWIYYDGSWAGNEGLMMEPGSGYIIKLANPNTLNYPDNGYTFPAKAARVPQGSVLESPAGIMPTGNMKNTMMVLGQLQLDESAYSTNPNNVVYAFIDDECRGMAAPAGQEGYIFMSIGENTEDTKTVNFKVWLDEVGMLVDLEESLSFGALKSVGDLDEPFIFSLGSVAGNQGSQIGKPYPNPFTSETTIPINLFEAAQVKLSLFNNMGQLVYSLQENHEQHGNHKLTINKESLRAGMYFYHIEIHTAKSSTQESGSLIIQ